MFKPAPSTRAFPSKRTALAVQAPAVRAVAGRAPEKADRRVVLNKAFWLQMRLPI